MLVSKYAFKYQNNILVKKLVKLGKCSGYYIHVKCECCNNIFTTLWYNREIRLKNGKNDMCNSCSRTGILNHQYGKDRKEITKYARSFVKNHSRKFSNETKKKMSITRSRLISEGLINIHSNNIGHKHYYTNSIGEKQHADSSLELLRMHQLNSDSNIKYWTKNHRIRIQYNTNALIKYCIPDFYIIMHDDSIVIEEVKGRITENDLLKKIAIQNYCNVNNYKFIFTTQYDLNKNGEYRKFLKELKNNEQI